LQVFIKGTFDRVVASSAFTYSNCSPCQTSLTLCAFGAGLVCRYGATLFSFGPFSALYFLFYESAKDFGLALEGVSEEKDLKYPTAVFGGSGVVAGKSSNSTLLTRSPIPSILNPTVDIRCHGSVFDKSSRRCQSSSPS